MKKLIQISEIGKNSHRDLTRYPPNPEQVKKLIASIGRTGFWNNLVVRPHPDSEGRYQLAYGHNRIAACQQAGVSETEPEVVDLSNYDMLCCMIDENLTQQHIVPKTIFEIVSAAIKEAEKMLRASNNVYDFNAGF